MIFIFLFENCNAIRRVFFLACSRKYAVVTEMGNEILEANFNFFESYLSSIDDAVAFDIRGQPVLRPRRNQQAEVSCKTCAIASNFNCPW